MHGEGEDEERGKVRDNPNSKHYYDAVQDIAHDDNQESIAPSVWTFPQ